MRRLIWTAALLLAPLAATPARAGDLRTCDRQCCQPTEPDWLKRWHPVGGWDPYGGGLLHWWNPRCFPCFCAPDDYCRKTLPCVCHPCYPPYFQYGPPAACGSQQCCPQQSGPAPVTPPR